MQSILYFEIETICAIILLLVYLLGSNKRSTHQDRWLYNRLTFLVFDGLITDGVTTLLEGRNTLVAILICQTFTFACDCLSCIVSFLWLLYTMLWVQGVEKLETKKIRLCAIPLLIGILTLILNIHFHLIYYFDDQNIYHRGPLFFLVFLISFLYVFSALVYSFYKAIREKDKVRKKKDLFISIMVFTPVVGSIVQALFYGIPLVWPGITISLLALYFNLQTRKEQEERLTIERMKYDLIKKDMSIMLSQIQPHFLYNALSTIKGLAMTDSDKACEAIDGFASFLRGNIDSLSAQGLISFEQELEHTKQYLLLEQMRFGDRLRIVYNLEVTAFNLPPLTLQPIVENAVRYGVTKKEDGGTVTISTKKQGDDTIITVSDDGLGFNPLIKKEDGRTHIGIQNVTDRIRTQCAGTLTITSTEGKGTVAVITIPTIIH